MGKVFVIQLQALAVHYTLKNRNMVIKMKKHRFLP